MKKILVTFLVGLGVSAFAFANNAEIFSYDANHVNEEMSQLQALENFVAVNPGVTLSNLEAENNNLLSDLNLLSDNFGGLGSMSGEPALGIPSFLWGCILGWVGILVVHLVTEDSAETKKALWGCILGYGLGGVAYIIFWVIYIMAYAYY